MVGNGKNYLAPKDRHQKVNKGVKKGEKAMIEMGDESKR